MGRWLHFYALTADPAHRDTGSDDDMEFISEYFDGRREWDVLVSEERPALAVEFEDDLEEFERQQQRRAEEHAHGQLLAFLGLDLGLESTSFGCMWTFHCCCLISHLFDLHFVTFAAAPLLFS